VDARRDDAERAVAHGPGMDGTRSWELFREAVLDLSDRATEENALRYLAASRLLEEQRRPQATADEPVVLDEAA
jgi:hypothetical protein